MKIECSTEKLKDAISKAEKIVGKTSTLESLKSILLIASGNSLKIHSTNLSLGLEVEIPAKIETEGELAVLGDVINDTLLNMGIQEKTVKLETISGNLHIGSKKSAVIIKSVPSEEFPAIPVVEGKSFTIPSDKFIDGIRSVFYSAAINDIKPEISSVYIYNNDQDLVFVATDSFRLAEKTIKIKGLGEIEGLIIPYKNVLEIIKLLSDNKDDLKITYNKNQISFILPGFYLTSRLIDGTFPDYRQIIPKGYKTRAIVLKKDLMEAVRLSNVFSDKFNQIKISIEPKNKKFIVEAINKDVGENKTAIDGSLEGENVEMNFNHKYVLDCFQAVNEDSVSMELNEMNRPVVVRGNGDKSFLYLIMPMNR